MAKPGGNSGCGTASCAGNSRPQGVTSGRPTLRSEAAISMYEALSAEYG